MTYALCLLAEEAAPTGTGGAVTDPGSPFGGIMIPMILGLGVFYLLLIRPQNKKRKEEERRGAGMLKNLTRNDHVMTIGGIHGIVASVTDDEVVLKVDEKSDVRVRVSRHAISKVVTEDGKDVAAEKK
jgi:preprotein translocase subunit YajC